MLRSAPKSAVRLPRPQRAARAAAHATAVLLATLTLLGGCAGTDVQRPVDPAFDLHHPDAARRTLAVQDVARRGDPRWLPDLVELLEDPDDTVRLQAGAALREMTGHDAGYRAYDGPVERRAAAAAWRAWLAGRQEGAARGGS